MTTTNEEYVSKEKLIRKITWIGLCINFILFGLKLTAGQIGDSRAVIADAIHTLTDSFTDFAVIIGSFFWYRPPDSSHPYGHRRIETLITLVIGLFLILASVGIAWDAIESLQSESTSHPGLIAFGATIVSIITKELIYRFTIKGAKRIKSSALASNAWHHRSDAISSLPASISVGIAIYFPEWAFLDQIGALIVTLMIFQAALKIIWPGIMELIDTGASNDACEKIKKIAYQNPHVRHVHHVRTRFQGNSLFVDFHLVVNGAISVFDGHQIAEDIKQQIIYHGPDVFDVVIHIEPDLYTKDNQPMNSENIGELKNDI